MTKFKATYNIYDDQIRLELLVKLDKVEFAELFARLKHKENFSWAPRQRAFYGVWTPRREDLLIELAGDIETIADNGQEGAEERAERFGGYSGNAKSRSSAAFQKADEIQSWIPAGQPILVGHHSERRHRRDLERIDNNMRRAVEESQKAEYWSSRAGASLAHFERKQDPGAILRRIEGYEARLRKWQRRRDGISVYPPDNIETDILEDTPGPDKTLCARWIEHLEALLDFHRQLYEESGKLAYDRGEFNLEVGGAVRKAAGFLPIIRVNGKSVTILDSWHYDKLETDKAYAFSDTVKKQEIWEALTRAEYESHPDYQRLAVPLLAAYQKFEQPATAGIKPVKGGAVKYKRLAGGVVKEFREVVSVGRKNIKVLEPAWLGNESHFEYQVPLSNVVEAISPEQWQEVKSGQ